MDIQNIISELMISKLTIERRSMENEIFNSLSFLLIRLMHAHRSMIRSQIQDLGLHRGQPSVLFALDRKDGLSNAEMADFLEITPATLTNKVKRMEKANLVIRKRDVDDERVNRIYLTDKGRSLMDELRSLMLEMESAMLEGFSESDISQLKDDVRKILENIEAHICKQD